jgi:hypothetical protein
MKIALFIDKKWKSLDKRVKDTETYLTTRYKATRGQSVTITVIEKKLGKPRLTFSKVVDESWFIEKTKDYRKDFDAFGWIISPSNWTGIDASAFYMIEDLQKFDFVLITDENTTYTTPDKTRHKQFEYTLEHEIGHAVSLDIGLRLNPDNSWSVPAYRDGFDNTHHFFHKGDIDGFYKDYNIQFFKKTSGLQKILDGMKTILDGLTKKKLSNQPVTDLLPEVKEKMEKLIQICDIMDMPIRVTSGFRSFEEQDRLYAQGRTTAGPIVTNARGGESDHNFGKAFDIVFRRTGYEGDWEFVGKIGKQLGLKWGGDWKGGFVDRPHFYID